MSELLQPVTLRGQHASLVPLTPAHGPALAEAARDGELWKLWYTTVPHAKDCNWLICLCINQGHAAHEG